jgi:predicted CoA-binding protein
MTESNSNSNNKTISPVEVLKTYGTIAVVSVSKNPEKNANSVPVYLKEHGYKIVPINPTTNEILGERAYASLLDLPLELANAIEVVEVFRPSEELPEIAKQTVEMENKKKKRTDNNRPLVF